MQASEPDQAIDETDRHKARQSAERHTSRHQAQTAKHNGGDIVPNAGEGPGDEDDRSAGKDPDRRHHEAQKRRRDRQQDGQEDDNIDHPKAEDREDRACG